MIIIEVNYELQYTPPESSPCGPSYYSTDIVYSDDPHVQVTLEEGRTAGGEWEVWGVIDAYVDCWGLVGTLEREGVETVDLELPRIDTYCNESR